MKNIFTLACLLCLFWACNPDKKSDYLLIEGKTMGTYYKVTYLDSLGRDFKHEVDSLLMAVNDEISTYVPTSTISQFNKADSIFELGLFYADYAKCVENPALCGKVKNKHFYANYMAAKVAHERTQKAFDPTVMQLVNYWGFGYTPHKAVTVVDSSTVDSLLQYVGFEKVTMLDRNGYAVLKKDSPAVQLDFGGTGQGYGVDAVSDFMALMGVKNYLVDIGGEERGVGINPNGQAWTIGINTPKSEAEVTDYMLKIQLKNNSVNTSGNYRNFHEVNGQKYSHFIDPRTGFPEKSTLLSATVFGKDCLTPDALATGFMVMGLDKAYTLASQMEGIEALFIYSDEKGELQVKYTPGVENMIAK